MADYGLEEVRAWTETITQFKTAEEIQAEIQYSTELRRHLVELEAHPGFKYFQKKLLEQLTGKLAKVFSAPEGLDSLVNGPYNSGEIAGIKLAVDLVKILSDTIKDKIEVQNKINAQEGFEDEENR